MLLGQIKPVKCFFREGHTVYHSLYLIINFYFVNRKGGGGQHNLGWQTKLCFEIFAEIFSKIIFCRLIKLRVNIFQILVKTSFLERYLWKWTYYICHKFVWFWENFCWILWNLSNIFYRLKSWFIETSYLSDTVNCKVLEKYNQLSTSRWSLSWSRSILQLRSTDTFSRCFRPRPSMFAAWT